MLPSLLKYGQNSLYTNSHISATLMSADWHCTFQRASGLFSHVILHSFLCSSHTPQWSMTNYSEKYLSMFPHLDSLLSPHLSLLLFLLLLFLFLLFLLSTSPPLPYSLSLSQFTKGNHYRSIILVALTWCWETHSPKCMETNCSCLWFLLSSQFVSSLRTSFLPY